MRTALISIAAVALTAGGSSEQPAQAERPQKYQFMATAYSVEGITRKGTYTEYGVVAADRSVLPLGTLIRVTGAASYSGVFVVEDTGEKVDGNHIDIYLPNYREAKNFGVRLVGVEVIGWGDVQVLPQSDGSK